VIAEQECSMNKIQFSAMRQTILREINAIKFEFERNKLLQMAFKSFAGWHSTIFLPSDRHEPARIQTTCDEIVRAILEGRDR
jgi:hypothetical protein